MSAGGQQQTSLAVGGGAAAAATLWQPQPGGLEDLIQCLKDAESGDSSTQRLVLEVGMGMGTGA